MDWNLIAIAFTPYMLLVCLLGVTLGILWGAMPGLSSLERPARLSPWNMLSSPTSG